MTLTEQFDKQLQGLVNTERQKDYGHPLDHFTVSARMKAQLHCADKILQHPMEMIVDKLARLCNTPDHLDSWIDIAGYARTAVMILDEREKRIKSWTHQTSVTMPDASASMTATPSPVTSTSGSKSG